MIRLLDLVLFDYLQLFCYHSDLYFYLHSLADLNSLVDELVEYSFLVEYIRQVLILVLEEILEVVIVRLYISHM